MRYFSACRAFLAAAIVIGATLSPLPASALETFTPVPATYDPATRVATLGVKLSYSADDCIRFYQVRLYEVESGIISKVISSSAISNGDDILYFQLSNYPLGRHTVELVLSGGICGVASATLTYVVPNVDWLPAVLDLLSD